MRLIIILYLVLTGSAGMPSMADDEDNRPVIYTTFYPMKYFVERIAGDTLQVVLPVPADADPGHWWPDTDTILAYQQADLIVANGAGFEQWIDKVSLPRTRLIKTAAVLRDELIEHQDVVTHSHGPSGEHTHGRLDGHTWLDPVNAKRQAAAIRDRLMDRFPEYRSIFETGFNSLASDLDELHAMLVDAVKYSESVPLLASHPAYNYLARRYGWDIYNLDLDPDTAPDDHTIGHISQLLTSHSADYLLWETRPDIFVADILYRDLGLKSVVFSPVEMLSPEQMDRGEDYVSIMRENIANIRIVFQSR